MRAAFIATTSRRRALSTYPWAAKCAKVDGGYMLFESDADYKTWKKVARAIAAVRAAMAREERPDAERDYAYARRLQHSLEERLGLKVLVMTDASSTDEHPVLNVTVWSAKGREIKNPDLRGTKHPNYSPLRR